MGKYLTNFKTKEEYEAFKASGEYLTPNVSFIETAGSVINDSYQIPTEGGGSGVAANDILYYMNNTADDPMFYIDLKTGELVRATSWFEDEELRNIYYSIDGDTISVRNPGNTFYYGIGTLTSVVADGEEIEALSGVVREVLPWQEELSVTKIGNWNFKLLE